MGHNLVLFTDEGCHSNNQQFFPQYRQTMSNYDKALFRCYYLLMVIDIQTEFYR